MTKWSRRKEKKCEIILFFQYFFFMRKEIFLNFSSHMKKNHEKMNFYLLKWAKSVIFCKKKKDYFLIFHCEKWFKKISFFSWKKWNFYEGFFFSHVGREEVVFSFPFSTITLKFEMWFSEKSQRVWFKEEQNIIFKNKHRLRSSKERTRMSICEKESLFHSYWKFESQCFYVRVLRIEKITTTKRYRLNESRTHA